MPPIGPVGKKRESNWLKSLTVFDREKVYKVMREIGYEADNLMEKHKKDLAYMSSRNSIPVGSAHIDTFLKSHAMLSFLAALQKGKTPEEAATVAELESRDAVTNHNAKRSDINWQRWTACQDPTIFNVRRRIVNCLKGVK